MVIRFGEISMYGILIPLAQAASKLLPALSPGGGSPDDQPIQIFGITLVGITRTTGKKLLMTLVLIAIVIAISWTLRGISRLVFSRKRSQKVVFWVRQAINILLALILLVGIVSIWFSDPTRMATFLGLVTAGLAFALQKPVSSLAGYVVIMRGKTFNIGDRIVMGGVRGDVIELGFIQTTIMEMGQPPPVQEADPAVWVHSRQYTGRVVTISNSMVFDEPVYNYTRDFPYIWDEVQIPISYKDDRNKAEQILLDVADHHTVKQQEMGKEAIEEMHRRYFTKDSDLHPTVYYRLTDNWLEMTVRFICKSHGVRALKDKMSREIIDGLDAAKIGIASSTYDIVGMPPIQVRLDSNNAAPRGLSPAGADPLHPRS
jgi:small-conductance mechanosensitive channel